MSGKRNKFGNFGVVNVEGAPGFRGNEGKGDSSRSLLPPSAQFHLDSAENQFLDRSSFTSGLEFELSI
jgi:hypothetical protein